MHAAQRIRQRLLIGRHHYLSHRLKRIDTHPGRASTRKKAKDHLFPEMSVRTSAADLVKFSKAFPYLAAACFVMPLDVLDRDGFSTSLHCG